MLFAPSADQLRPPSGAARLWDRLRAFADLAWRWRNLLLLLVAIAAAGAYFGIPVVLGPVVATERVTNGDFIQSVVATGNVLAPYRVNIGSQIVGVVTDVPVAEGQSVTAGQALITLDDREARAAVIQAEGALAQAQARVRQLRELVLPSAEEALTQARATLLNAQQAYDRANQLASTGYGQGHA